MKALGFLCFIFLTSFFAKPIISVSIPPQAYFLKQIAGDSLEINILVDEGSDPHTFEFKPSTLLQLQKSELYLTLGLEFEKIWIPKFKANLPHTQILSITEGIPFLEEECEEHAHKNHDHSHEHHDPHIWLSPKLAKILSQNITKILIQHYPKNQKLYEHNLQDFLSRIQALEQKINQSLTPLNNRSFATYHPAWSYFAKDFHLQEIAIEFEGKEPTPQELAKSIALIKEKQIKVIFTQKGLGGKASATIARSCSAILWPVNPLAYEWEKQLLHFTQGLLQ